MTTAERKRLEISACKVRAGAFQAIRRAQSGHLSHTLSSAGLLIYLCFKEMNIAPKDSEKQTGISSYSQAAIAPQVSMRLLRQR